MSKQAKPADEVWSAPESGTVRDDTSGNKPSDRGINPGQGSGRPTEGKKKTERDDPSIAGEER